MIKDRETSLLGLGCMRLPVIDDDYGKIDYDKAETIFLECLNKGVNYFDTAYVYHKEKSEQFLGDMIQKHCKREDVIVSDKIPAWKIECHEDFMTVLDEMLDRLQMDYLDYCFIHSLSQERWEHVLKHNVFDFIDEAKRLGKIKNIGFSFHDKTEVFESIAKGYDKWDFAMIMFNYMDIDNQGGEKAYKLLKELGIPMFVMEGLKGGKLATPPQEILDIYKEAGKQELSPVEVAFRWIASHDNVKVILSGMSTLEQAQENVSIFSRVDTSPLTDVEATMYDKAMAKINAMTEIDCTDCKYCMPCPVGVNIPWCFGLYNQAHMYNAKGPCSRDYFSPFNPESQRASKCIRCGQCESLCPQHLKIMDGLEQVADYFEGQ